MFDERRSYSRRELIVGCVSLLFIAGAVFVGEPLWLSVVFLMMGVFGGFLVWRGVLKEEKESGK